MGHGGMPVSTGAPGSSNPPVAFYDPRSNYDVGDNTTAGYNGFVNLTINGPSITFDYRDVENKPVFSEAFLANADATISYSFENPPPILVPGA